ncbi:hypothetical protein ACFQT0_24055 [Hymenobacter humi]|uniref:TonB-dependent transporter Oar-like beta-barrel domain-containing protein n=1 Tax=Hymenobacter humi TaxID=1411620 RepID=A0ABW2UCQ5_9BACT
MRVDVPLFLDKPGNNTAFNTFESASRPGFGSEYKTTNTPNGQLLFSPRLGFNWDVNNDAKVQLRGGTGIFSGRVPFVWISNSYTNSGMIQGGVSQTAPNTTPPSFLPSIPLTPAEIQRVYTSAPYAPVATSQINLARNDFKLPQVWRSNLAVDFRLPGDVVATLEGIYSKTLNDIYYKDINLTAPVGRLAGPDQRPVYATTTAARRIDARYTNVYLLDNTSKGYRYNGTFQLQKRFDNGLNATTAYTYGQSKEINSGSSSTASSNYGFNQVMADPNNPGGLLAQRPAPPRDCQRRLHPALRQRRAVDFLHHVLRRPFGLAHCVHLRPGPRREQRRQLRQRPALHPPRCAQPQRNQADPDQRYHGYPHLGSDSGPARCLHRERPVPAQPPRPGSRAFCCPPALDAPNRPACCPELQLPGRWQEKQC